MGLTIKSIEKILTISLAVIALPLAGLAEEKTQDPPNIVFILADDKYKYIAGDGRKPAEKRSIRRFFGQCGLLRIGFDSLELMAINYI